MSLTCCRFAPRSSLKARFRFLRRVPRQQSAEVTRMSIVMTSRDFPLTAFVRVKDVMRALGCSRSLAYEHLRRAAQRTPGARGLLRVPVRVWEKYVLEVYRCGSSSVGESGGVGTTTMGSAAIAPPNAGTSRLRSSLPETGNETPLIRITQPRGPRR